MAYAKHIIERQVIELEIPKDMDRLAVQNQVSNIYHQQVVPLLDELLSKKSASSTITIDRLELDIGNIPVNELEQVLAEKISLALQNKLEQVIVTPKAELPLTAGSVIPQQQNHTDAELLIHFLQTGLFPWWAQETTYAYLEKILKGALLRRDADFKRNLTVLLQTEEAVKRLVYTFSDALLEQMVKVYTTVDLINLLKQKEPLFEVFTGRLTLEQLRVLWWTEIFHTTGSDPGYAENELFEKAGWQFVKRAAQQAAWPALLRWYHRNQGKPGVLESTTGFIRSDNETGAVLIQQEAKKEKTDEKTANENLEAATPDITDEKKAKEIREAATPDTANLQLALNEPDTEQNNKDNTPENVVKQPSESRRLQLSEDKDSPSEAKKPQGVIDIDKLYIQNAGLVLLWPFLHRFFQHTELADDKTFSDKGDAERACLLLQYLATGSPEMFEAQLPLNKMLCGIPLLQPINTQWYITEKEKEEAEKILLAVIQHGGPGWKNLSVTGLRQAYLSREGILSSRDGAWLLQVERKSYDILTDRLPWAVQVVKLPWMERLVFVEW